MEIQVPTICQKPSLTTALPQHSPQFKVYTDYQEKLKSYKYDIAQ
jgi:hypothetical protein